MRTKGEQNMNIRLDLFGRVRLRGQSRSCSSFPTVKCKILLAFLGLHPDQEHPRSRLMDVLWPETDLDTARSRLNVTVHMLKKSLEAAVPGSSELLGSDRNSVWLDSSVQVDVVEFLNLADAARQASDVHTRRILLQEMVALYSGPVGAGLEEGPRPAEWLAAWRTNCLHAYLDAITWLASDAMDRNAGAEAMSLYRQAMMVESANKEVSRSLAHWLKVGGGDAVVATPQTDALGQSSAWMSASVDELATSILRALSMSGLPGLNPDRATVSVIHADGVEARILREIVESGRGQVSSVEPASVFSTAREAVETAQQLVRQVGTARVVVSTRDASMRSQLLHVEQDVIRSTFPGEVLISDVTRLLLLPELSVRLQPSLVDGYSVLPVLV